MASLCFMRPDFRSWLFLVLMFVFGCGAIPTPEAQPAPSAQSALDVGPTLDSPYVIRVCVKQPGVPRHKYFWANDGSGRLVLDDWELGLQQRNGQRIYYFDQDANPESAQMLPLPHNTLQCVEPPPSVLSSNGKSRAKREPDTQQAPKPATPTNTAHVAAPPPCTDSTEPGQTRRPRSTTTHTCTRPKTLKAPTRMAQAAQSAQQQSPTLAQSVPQPEPASLPLADWNLPAGLPNQSLPGLDPQRVMECVGSLCHARHPNFAPKGGKPAANGLRESRALPNGGAGGAKAPKTRKPPTGPKPAAKPATTPTTATPQTTTTTVVKGKTPPTNGGARLPPRGTPERRAIETAREKGVRLKKAEELANIRAGGKGSGVWTDKELADMRKGGDFPPGTNWHHDPTVANRPDLAADPSVVRPVRGGRKGHLEAHGGDWKKP
jgi:GHH signature containing HNH/Endo VII superfamily nuclease toxin